MVFYNKSTRDFAEAYRIQTGSLNVTEDTDSIYDELESAVEEKLEKARESKKARDEALGGGEVENGEDDGSISLASTFGALAIAATALAF